MGPHSISRAKDCSSTRHSLPCLVVSRRIRTLRAGLRLPAVGFQFLGYRFGLGLPCRRRVRREGHRSVQSCFPSDSGERDLVFTIVVLAVHISGAVAFSRNGQTIPFLNSDCVGVVVLLEPVTRVCDFNEMWADHGELPRFPCDSLGGLRRVTDGGYISLLVAEKLEEFDGGQHDE